MVKLKLQYFDPLMQKACSFVKTLMLSKIKSRRSKGQHRIRWLDGITDLMHMSLSKMFEIVKVMVFLVVIMDVRVGVYRKLNAEELMLLNCGVEEDC